MTLLQKTWIFIFMILMIYITANANAETIAEVRSCNGAPTIFVNGKPVTGMWFCGYLGARRTFQYSEAGINIFYIKAKTEPVPGSYKLLDNQALSILSVNPDAWIILRIQLPVRKEFADKFPDELMHFDNGATGPYLNPAKASVKDKNMGRFSFASELWKTQMTEELKELIRHVRSSSYGDRVIGYAPGGGLEYQWIWWQDYDRSKFDIDFSPAMQSFFRKWLIEKYKGDISALRKAWGSQDSDFKNITIPSKKERLQYALGYFYSPVQNQKVIDYFICHNDAVSDMMIHFSKIVKLETNNHSLAGCFFNPLHALFDAPRLGNARYNKIYNCPTIDFIASPYTYENRGPGDAIEFTDATASLIANGKLYVCEADSRTFLADDPNYGTPKDEKESLSLLWRDFSKILTTSSTGYWYGFSDDWFSPEKFPALIPAWKKMQEISEVSLAFDRSSNSEIAAIVNEKGLFSGNQRMLSYNALEKERIYELCRLGSMPDYFDFQDIMKHPDLCKKYKVFIFLNPYCLDDAEREFIESHLKTGNKWLIWLYGAGLINPDAAQALSVKNISSLTGMNVAQEKGSHKLQMEILDNKLLPGLITGSVFGSFIRPITTAPGISKSGPITPAPTYGNPEFYIEDEQVQPLAKFIDTGKVGFALKKYPDWTSVYIGSTSVSAGILRPIIKAAGVNSYTDGDDIVHQNKHFLAIHTATPGIRHIKLPERSDVFDLIDNVPVGRNINEFSVNLNEKDTKFYFTGNIEELQKAIETVKKEFCGQAADRNRKIAKMRECIENENIEKRSSSELRLKTQSDKLYHPDKEGIIHHWLICGPFPEAKGVDIATPSCKNAPIPVKFQADQVTPEIAFEWFGPLYTGKNRKLELSWKSLAFPGRIINPETAGVDFFTFSHITWYAACYLTVKQEEPVKISLAADDGYMLWINDQLVGQQDSYAGMEPLKTHEAILKPGKNKVLLQIKQARGPTMFQFKVTGNNDNILSNIAISLEP